MQIHAAASILHAQRRQNADIHSGMQHTYTLRWLLFRRMRNAQRKMAFHVYSFFSFFFSFFRGSLSLLNQPTYIHTHVLISNDILRMLAAVAKTSFTYSWGRFLLPRWSSVSIGFSASNWKKISEKQIPKRHNPPFIPLRWVSRWFSFLHVASYCSRCISFTQNTRSFLLFDFSFAKWLLLLWLLRSAHWLMCLRPTIGPRLAQQQQQQRWSRSHTAHFDVNDSSLFFFFRYFYFGFRLCCCWWLFCFLPRFFFVMFNEMHMYIV